MLLPDGLDKLLPAKVIKKAYDDVVHLPQRNSVKLPQICSRPRGSCSPHSNSQPHSRTGSSA